MTDRRAGPATDDVGDHIASAARSVEHWLRLGGHEPSSITTLKPARRKSAVYRLHGAAPTDVVAKRALASTLAVEYAVYGVLSRLPVASVRCLGIVDEPGTARAWLFTEYVDGDRLSGSNADHRAMAGRWLAAVHVAASSLVNEVSLPRRDAEHHIEVVRCAARTVLAGRASPAIDAEDARTLDRIAAHCEALERWWCHAVEITAVLPPTLVHGGFTAKNVRIRGGQVFAFDWEAAGRGTPAADLASIDAGAYHRELSRGWPAVTARSVERLALLGRILASVSAIPGERRSLESAWPHHAMAKMRVYEQRIANARMALALEG